MRALSRLTRTISFHSVVSVLGFALAFASCSSPKVVGPIAFRMDNLGTVGMSPLYVNGTYNGCASKPDLSLWSMPVMNYGGALDHSTVNVVLNDTACVLRITEIVINDPVNGPTVFASAPIRPDGLALTGAFMQPLIQFKHASTSIYAMGRITPSNFSGPFLVEVLYADQPNNLPPVQIGGVYSNVTPSNLGINGITAPDYGTNQPILSTVSFTLTPDKRIDTFSGIITIPSNSHSGLSYIVVASILGGGMMDSHEDVHLTFTTGVPVSLGPSSFSITSPTDPIILNQSALGLAGGTMIGTETHRYLIISTDTTPNAYQVIDFKFTSPP